MKKDRKEIKNKTKIKIIKYRWFIFICSNKSAANIDIANTDSTGISVKEKIHCIFRSLLLKRFEHITDEKEKDAKNKTANNNNEMFFKE